MTYSVHQHWDPLKVCVVGRSYPPEFYSWIKTPHVRELFEKIAIETEEDFSNIIKKLQEFGVKVLRPDLPENPFDGQRFIPPPMTPRDHTIMIGDRFYENIPKYFHFHKPSYDAIKDPNWPECQSWQDFNGLPEWIIRECVTEHNFGKTRVENQCYDKIFQDISSQGNKIYTQPSVNGAMCARLGRDLFFGTSHYDQSVQETKKEFDLLFPEYRNHVVNTGGHSDGTYCPVCPGLIISLYDVPTYADTFPGWEVIYLPSQSWWSQVSDFLELKKKNRGRWWLPGFEHDQSVIDVVETWLSHWTGYVEETVFDVNMLIIDPKNVMVFNYNKQVFDALDRYGITPHVVPFRHRYFWDGGIHCVTTDLHRDGTLQDFF